MLKLINLLASEKVINNLKRLYPKWEVREKTVNYYTDKIKYCICIFLAGMIVTFAIHISSGNVIEDGGRIKRNGYGQGDKNVTLMVNDSEVNFKISEKKYAEDEIKRMLPEFKEELFEIIKGDNASLDHVESDLNFVSRIDNYPFNISYRTDKPLILSSKGKLDPERLTDDGIEVLVSISITYSEYEEETSFFITAFKRKLTGDEQFDEDLKTALDKEKDNKKEDDYYYLPISINGQQINFSEKKNESVIFAFFISIVVTILVYVLKDRDLEKEVRERDNKLSFEYPVLINKFTLLYSAGMPVKNIWMKICAEYIDEKNSGGEFNPLYEEMIVTKKQMTDGKRELDAYEDFARRVTVQRYRVFVSLICQAVTTGRDDLSISFKNECNDAYLERKNNAKKKYEEASTKLMVPMFMMLSVVIIILMFPAFYSFKM